MKETRMKNNSSKMSLRE